MTGLRIKTESVEKLQKTLQTSKLYNCRAVRSPDKLALQCYFPPSRTCFFITAVALMSFSNASQHGGIKWCHIAHKLLDSHLIMF